MLTVEVLLQTTERRQVEAEEGEGGGAEGEGGGGETEALRPHQPPPGGSLRPGGAHQR